MTDAISAIERLEADYLFQVPQLSFGAANLQAVPIPANRNTCRVVAAILESSQTVNNDWNDALLTHISHDSAHLETAPD
jgi:hypothetical protein